MIRSARPQSLLIVIFSMNYEFESLDGRTDIYVV